jgi:hypothetical protein
LQARSEADLAAIAGAIVLLALAGFATFIGLVSYAILCEWCDGKPPEQTWQFVFACAGLVAAALMTAFTVVRRSQAAVASLVVAIVLYAAWAVLLDAATHGWGSGPIPF